MRCGVFSLHSQSLASFFMLNANFVFLSIKEQQIVLFIRFEWYDSGTEHGKHWIRAVWEFYATKYDISAGLDFIRVQKKESMSSFSWGFFLVTRLYWFLWDSGCSLLICCDGARYLCLCLFVCPSIKRHFRLKSSLQESVAGFFWMWSCVLLPKLRIKHITLHVCQLIGLIAALNRFNVSPRQCGGFTDNLQLHDAHGEKRLGPLGPAPVLWTQHVKCLRQNSCLFMKTRVGGWEGGSGNKGQKLQRRPRENASTISGAVYGVLLRTW